MPLSSSSSGLKELDEYAAQLLDRVQEFDDTTASTLTSALVQAAKEQCARDGLYWLRFVTTRDEADPEAPTKLFPVLLEYVQSFWAILRDCQCVVCAKSRQMLVSWIVAAFCCWWARFRPHQVIYWQTQQWKDAVAMTCAAEGSLSGRCQFIEDHLPKWLSMPYKSSEGCLSYSNGSTIQALAGGADQIRGKVASIIVEDEFARQEEAAGVYTAIAPLIQKGAKLIVVSTPNGVTNQFATLFHGRVQYQ